MKRFYISFLFVLCTFTMSFAQSWKDYLNKENVQKAVSNVAGSSEKIDLLGSWNYTGVAVEFESDNIFKKASGSVAASTIEKKIDTQLNKIGLKENVATVTFNSDSTFIMETTEKNKSGKYIFDAENNKVHLDIVDGKSLTASVSKTGNQISLLFNADKLIDVINFISEQSPDSTLKSITSLLNAYDGIKIGLDFTKK